MSNLQNNINKVKTISQQNAELTYQNSCLLEMIASDYAESQLAKQKLVDAINLACGSATMDNSLSEIADMFKSLMSRGVPMSGANGTMDYDCYIGSALDVIKEFAKMIKYVDNYSTTIPRYLGGVNKNDYFYIQAKHVEYTNATEEVYSCFSRYIYMEILRLPKLVKEDSGFSNSRYCWKYIREIYVPKLSSFKGFSAYNATDGGLKDLIDITIGGGATTGTFNLGTIPFTNAILSSNSLLTEQDLLNGFTTNKEKWLWNLRNHFAALLGETTNGQIVFTANAYAALDEETITAFTSKGWTVASA